MEPERRLVEEWLKPRVNRWQLRRMDPAARLGTVPAVRPRQVVPSRVAIAGYDPWPGPGLKGHLLHIFQVHRQRARE